MDLTIPLNGLNRAGAALDRAASVLAQAPLSVQEPPRDVIELSPAMVAMLEARNSYIANLRAAKTMDEPQRVLLDQLGE